MDETSVSVVIPVFDALESLKAAIASVTAQTLRPLEILVVDDASATPLEAPAPVRLLRTSRNLGPAAARNLGIAAAVGRFVAFLDADDLWFPGKLAAQATAAMARADPDDCVCIAETWERWPNGDRRRTRWRPESGPLGDYLFVSSGAMQTSSLFVARKLALAHPFDEGLRQYEDLQFLLGLEAAGADFAFQDEKLFVWRRGHGGRQQTQRLHYASGHAFLEAARPILTLKAAAAFEARHFGPALLRRQPLAFAGAAFRAWRLGAVSAWGLAGAVRASLSTEVC